MIVSFLVQTNTIFSTKKLKGKLKLQVYVILSKSGPFRNYLSAIIPCSTNMLIKCARMFLFLSGGGGGGGGWRYFKLMLVFYIL